mgnify:CR=1 FL=1
MGGLDEPVIEEVHLHWGWGVTREVSSTVRDHLLLEWYKSVFKKSSVRVGIRQEVDIGTSVGDRGGRKSRLLLGGHFVLFCE